MPRQPMVRRICTIVSLDGDDLRPFVGSARPSSRRPRRAASAGRGEWGALGQSAGGRGGRAPPVILRGVTNRLVGGIMQPGPSSGGGDPPPPPRKADAGKLSPLARGA